MTVKQIYEQTIHPLPAPDRLRLARMILEGIPAESIVDDSDEWSEQDLIDFTNAGWARADDAEGNRNAY